MSLPYFYEPVIHQPKHNLSEESARHCMQVLRLKENDPINLTDGKGNLFTATIINADKKNCTVKIEDAGYRLQDSGYKQPEISIAISLLKNTTRLEWFMEKVTEIGVHTITPLICEHTEKQNFRFDRMNSILISAMLQSQQTWLPQLHQPKKFIDFIDEDFDGIKLIAHCADEEKHSLKDMQFKQAALILIGPEGDFSTSEINTALQKNFVPVSLGNTRLRTETAGIVAAALLCR